MAIRVSHCHRDSHGSLGLGSRWAMDGGEEREKSKRRVQGKQNHSREEVVCVLGDLKMRRCWDDELGEHLRVRQHDGAM